MAKVSLYLNKHLKFLVKTNMDLQERQEEALDSNLKSKHIKEINSKNKEIEENINNLKLEEFDEKNKEDKLMNNNINIVNNENEKNNNIDNINQNNKIKIKEIMHNDNNINDINNIYEIKKNKNIIEEEKNPEDPLISYITSNRKISEELIKNSSKLIIEEIEGKLFNEKIIEINAGGMVGGRNKKDGFTIFGQNPEKSSNKDIFIPDLELNILNNENNFSYPYIFTIYYKIEDKSYYIRAYSGKGSENKILFI